MVGLVEDPGGAAHVEEIHIEVYSKYISQVVILSYVSYRHISSIM